MRNPTLAAWALVAGLGAISVIGQTRQVDDGVLLNPPAEEWVSYGRDYAETHHSPLTQVNAAKPEPGLLSDAEPLKMTGLVNQLFNPAVAVIVAEMVGFTVSTLALRVPINEVSVYEESAQ